MKTVKVNAVLQKMNRVFAHLISAEQKASGIFAACTKSGGAVFYVPSIGSAGLLSYLKNIREILIENGPFAAVHAHTDFQTGFAALAAKLAGVPVRICHSHNTAWKRFQAVL